MSTSPAKLDTPLTELSAWKALTSHYEKIEDETLRELFAKDPDRGTRLPGPGMTRGFHSAFWKTGDLDFAAVSDIDSAAFEKFSALARAQRE